MNGRKDNFTNSLTSDKLLISSLLLTEHAADVLGIEMNGFQRGGGVAARISFNLSPAKNQNIRTKRLKTRKLATVSHFWKSLS